ncbi:MAG TPA: M48 family metalloprotease [Opitutaceae bacterium]|nr:M48 family metalloprotease [Opitutaceae bacterium]
MALMLGGCISFTVVNSGEDPGEAIDYAGLGREIFKEAEVRSAALASKSVLLPESDARYQQALAILDQIRAANQRPKASFGGGMFGDRAGSFEYFNQANIRLHIIVDDAPVAVVFPNGHLYITTGIVDSSLPYAAKSKEQLAAVLCHEFVHFREGHVFLQWLTIAAQSRAGPRKALSAITKVLPIVSYEYSPSAERKLHKDYDKVIEFIADADAVAMLDQLGYPRVALFDYLQTLERYRKNVRGREVKESSLGWLDVRVKSLRRLFQPTEAAVTFDDPETHARRTIKLTADNQYNLSSVAQAHMSPEDRVLIEGWLDHPEGVDLFAARGKLSETGLRYFMAFVQSWAMTDDREREKARAAAATPEKT